MTISFIAAIADNDAIGRDNQLPWHMPEDLKFFKRTTLAKPVVMGRKSYESLGKPLPGRLNIVLSKTADLPLPDGVLLFAEPEAAIAHLEQTGADEIFIIGGGKIFAQTMGLADRMYLTRIHTAIPDGDAFFPHIDHTHWKLVWEEAHPADERHIYPYTFQRYERTEL